MNSKRGREVLFRSLIFVFGCILFSNFASAYSSPQYFIQSVIEGVKGIAAPIFSALFGMYYTDEFLFTKILLFILLFVVIRTGVKAAPMFEGKTAVASLISLVISLLSVRFISENDLIKGILLPYGTLGIAVTVLIPFVLFFYAVEKTGKSGGWRKAAWLFYFIIMLILWINRRNDISEEANYIYLGVVVLCLLLFFFDRHIRRYFDVQSNRQTAKNSLERRLVYLQSQYAQAAEIQSDAAKNQRKVLIKEIKQVEDEIHKL